MVLIYSGNVVGFTNLINWVYFLGIFKSLLSEMWYFEELYFKVCILIICTTEEDFMAEIHLVLMDFFTICYMFFNFLKFTFFKFNTCIPLVFILLSSFMSSFLDT